MTLSYKTYGSPLLPPLVCFHGMLGSKEDFDKIAKTLSQVFYMVAVDLPGFGQSSLQPSREGWIYLQEILTSFMLELDIESPSLLGYSLGGRIALSLIPHLPSIDHLFILSAKLSIPREEKEAQQEQSLSWNSLLHTLSDEDFLRRWYTQPLFDTLNQTDLLEAIIEKRIPLKRNTLAYYFRHLSAATQPSFHDTLKRCKKGLFLFGKKDQNYADHYEKHHKDYPHLQFSSILGSSHALLEECPEKVAFMILDFLGKTHDYSHARNPN